MRLALAGLLLLFNPSGFAAAAEPAPRDTLTIELDRGEVLIASKLEPRADSMVKVTRLDGRSEYVAGARIRSIRDTAGEDLTERVLRDRETVGTRRRYPGKPEKYVGFRFRPGPPSACGAYMITESALLSRESSGSDGYILIEYGYARNFGKSHSVGATSFLGLNSDMVQEGVRLRLVEWLNSSVSVNFSPGIVLAGDAQGNAEFHRPQFTAQAGVNFSGRVGFVVDMFTTDIRQPYPFDEPKSEHAPEWHVGFRLGAEPGLAGTIGGLYLGALVQAGD